MEYKKVRMFDQNIHTFTVNASQEGVALRAYTPPKLSKVQDMTIDWFEQRDEWRPVFKCNWSFFNTETARRLGCSMEGGKWQVEPYETPYFVDMSWDNRWLRMFSPCPESIQADFVKGCVPLVYDGEKEISVDVSKIQKVAPRIALGQKAFGELVFAWTDQRPSGLSFDQLAEVMLALECTKAFAGDGGGSVTAVVDEEVITSSGREVVDMLCVYATEDKEVTKVSNNPDKIILHHSATSDGVTKDFDAIRNYHKNVLGWSDIGYHYVIEKVKGQIWTFKGRDISKRGAHCRPENGTSIGVCIVGNYDENKLSKGQINALLDLQAELETILGKKLPIHFHKEFSATTCPGKNITKDILAQPEEAEENESYFVTKEQMEEMKVMEGQLIDSVTLLRAILDGFE